MAGKEQPLPSGCWALLCGIPAQLLVLRFAEPWGNLLTPHLPQHLSAEAKATIYGFSLLALLFMTWMASLKFVDVIFGTTLFPYRFAKGEQPSERARWRHRGIQIIAGIIVVDQLSKLLFGVEVHNHSHLPRDTSLIVNSLALAMFAIAWWFSRDRLRSLALSVAGGGAVSSIGDQALRAAPVALPIHIFGFSGIFTLAEIALLAGMGLYAVTSIFDFDKGDATTPPQAH